MKYKEYKRDSYNLYTIKTDKFKDGVPVKEYIKNWSKEKINENDKMFKLAKGSIEFSSIVGSVVGLTILAPEISHLILHPIMKVLHFEDKHEKSVDNNKKIDKQA